MSQIHASAAQVIDAQPEEIYAILADYHNQHPHILPKQYFKSLEIESGGQGAGTVFRSLVRVNGVERRNHMLVSEPAPGVLVETDTDTGMKTTFTITPVQDGKQANLEIATDWEASPGLAGLMEKVGSPPVMRRIYRAELRQLAEYVKTRQPAASQS